MSVSLAHQLIRYRNVLVAIANAGLTWIILIIAPLGLFAVITCTVLVFFSSLATGWVGDLLLSSLLQASDRSGLTPLGDQTDLNPGNSTTPRPSFPTRSPRHLPRS